MTFEANGANASATGSVTTSGVEVFQFTDGTRYVPLIISNGGGDTAAITLTAGTALIATVTANAADSFGVQFSLNSGADVGLFDLDPFTGILSFISAPSFVQGADNTYEVVVRSQDSDGLFDLQKITVTVAAPAHVIDYRVDSNLNAMGDIAGIDINVPDDYVFEQTGSGTTSKSAADVISPIGSTPGYGSTDDFVVYTQDSLEVGVRYIRTWDGTDTIDAALGYNASAGQFASADITTAGGTDTIILRGSGYAVVDGGSDS